MKRKEKKNKNNAKGTRGGMGKGNDLFDENNRFNWLDHREAQLNELYDVRLIIKDNALSRVNAIP